MSRAPDRPLSPAAWAALYATALGVCFAIYAPCLRGPFLSDDLYYVWGNRVIHEPSLAHVREILAPRSDLTMMAANYAPVHLLVHMAQWQIFGDDTLGYHVGNLLLHAGNALLLALLLLRAGLRRVPALLGAAFFLVHPANVEAVAWISQVKTQVAMLLMLAALVVFERRVALGSIAFALSFGAKATSAVALPVAAAWDVIRGERPGRSRARKSLAAWTALSAALAAAQFVAFRHAHLGVEPLSDSRAVQLWTSAAIGARYLWMALTSLGVSTFQEPAPAETLLDPWALGGVAAAVALGARLAWALWRRREEGAWWLWAAVSFGPVAQVFPFLYPMADRYLYFILPGLIGGALFLAADLAGRAGPRWQARFARAGVVLVAAALPVFAARSHDRAGVWVSEARIFADGVRHYPEGAGAAFVRARQAAAAGDVAQAVEYARRATRRGHRDFEDFLRAPEFAPLRGAPQFDAFLEERARRRVELLERTPRLDVSDRLAFARALLLLREPARAAAVLREDPASFGAWAPEADALLQDAERAQQAQERQRGTPGP